MQSDASGLSWNMVLMCEGFDIHQLWFIEIKLLNLKKKKNLNELFCGYQQTDSKVFIEKQKAWNSQHNIKEEQIQKTDSTQL